MSGGRLGGKKEGQRWGKAVKDNLSRGEGRWKEAAVSGKKKQGKVFFKNVRRRDIGGGKGKVMGGIDVGEKKNKGDVLVRAKRPRRKKTEVTGVRNRADDHQKK